MKLPLLTALLLPLTAAAHDPWVQVNVVKQEAKQPVYADLMLGNHGNGHRDFLLASKIPLEASTLTLVGGNGAVTDLKPGIVDTGSEEKEGYWSVKIPSPAAGLQCVTHTYDAVVKYAPKRVVKSAKTYFISAAGNEGGVTFSQPLGHALEIIPLDDPTKATAGTKLKVRVLLKGQPLADTVVSCIPRGVELDTGFDANHEAKTDAKGEAELPLPEANRYLVVTHKKAPEETGENHSAGTDYAATLTLLVGEK
jgi:uncharacterized GH25 family protein